MRITHRKGGCWTYSAVETALCLWEAVLAIYDETDERGEKTEDAKLVEQLWDAVGAFTMRAAVASMTDDCDKVFEAYVALHGDYNDAFDWTWCPQFIRDSLRNGLFDQAIEWQHTPDEKIIERTDWAYPLTA